jgi:hypothetical protein
VSRTDGLDPLYEAPPREFVAARNALAARLGKAGDEAGARRVRAIARPTAAVWSVNHVARRSPRVVRAVVDAFDALKNAQLRNPGATPAGVETLRRALDGATREAMGALTGAGMKPSLDIQRRIDGTLRGAAASMRGPLLGGTLAEELSAPGFDVFGGAVPTGTRRLHVVKPTAAPSRDGASGRDDARDDARQRRAAREAMLERRATQLEDEAGEAERDAEAAASAAHEARQRLRELEAKARATARRASQSRARARTARARVNRPGGGGAPRNRRPRTPRASPAPRRTPGPD